MGPQKPNIIIVPGAFSFASTFSRLLDKLKTLEYPAEVLELLSAGSPVPRKGLDDDAVALRSILSRIVEQGKEIVLIAHSYGGIVASNSAEEFTLARRKELGKQGGVIQLIFMAAFVVPKGKTLFGLLGGKPPNWMIVEDDIIKTDPALLADAGYSDLLPEELVEFSLQMTHTSASCFISPATYEPWKNVPCAYIYTTKDAALPYSVQQHLASQLGGATTWEINSGHCPHISAPEKVVTGIEWGIKAVSGKGEA